jgi:hypothetical protein
MFLPFSQAYKPQSRVLMLLLADKALYQSLPIQFSDLANSQPNLKYIFFTELAIESFMFLYL